MLAEADTIQKTKELKDLALTAADWARRKGMGEEAVQYARSYALEAERKMGQMLKESERARPAVGSKVIGAQRVPMKDIERQTLAELGLTKRESSNAQMLASLQDEKFEAIVSGRKTISAIRREIEQKSRRDMSITIPEGKFSVILSDPPWQYNNSGFDQSAEAHYKTMLVEEICNLSELVDAWSTPETVLFLWATNPLLPEALRVMAAWNFEYKTNMAWIKDRPVGLGWFLKSKHELLLIGVRKNTPHPKRRPDSYFEADRGRIHSKKPDVVYEIIESMYDGKKLEMFARDSHEGWSVHGNEI